MTLTEGHMTLREFFLELLADENLRAYWDDRDGYVRAKQSAGVLYDEDAELILSGTLREIEERIASQHSSARPVPLIVVFPSF